MKSSTSEEFRPLLYHPLWVAIGGRPNVSAKLGDSRGRVSNLTNMDLFATHQRASYVKDTMELRALKFPSAVDVAYLRQGSVADGSMGELTKEECVDPRAGWLRILGGGYPGGRYHLWGRGPEKLRKAARSSLACEALVMAQISEAIQEFLPLGGRNRRQCGQRLL